MSELVDELRETKHEALNLRFRNATGQLENTAEIGKVRRQIARINTLIREREIVAAEAVDEAEQSQRGKHRRGAADGRQPTTRAIARSARKVREGIVTSAGMDKTIVVTVTDRVRHAKYNKFVLKSKKLYTHDEANDAGVGDRVRVMETRPMSKSKRWRLVDVVERAR